MTIHLTVGKNPTQWSEGDDVDGVAPDQLARDLAQQVKDHPDDKMLAACLRDVLDADAVNKSFGDAGNTQQRIDGGRFGPASASSNPLGKLSTAGSTAGTVGNSKVYDLINTGVKGQPGTQTGIQADELKDQVVYRLSQLSGLSYARTNALTATWSGSSSDTQPDSIALQMAAAQEFGVAPTDYISNMASEMSAAPQEVINGIAGGWDGTAADFPTFDARVSEAQTFVQAMYAYTQETLATQGITSVTAYRGIGFDSAAPADSPISTGVASAAFDANAVNVANYTQAAQDGSASLAMNPISSWSVSADTATTFAHQNNTGGGAFVLSADIPASRILSTAATGIGCQREGELTVIGGSHVGTVNVDPLPTYANGVITAGTDLVDTLGGVIGASPATVQEFNNSHAGTNVYMDFSGTIHDTGE